MKSTGGPFNDRGVALVATLAVMAVLLAAGLQLSRLTTGAVSVSMMEKNRFQAEQLAISGIEAARLILAEDAYQNDIDSVQEDWADPDALARMLTDLGLPANDLTVRIYDELACIQVNALIREFPGHEINPDQVRIWQRFFSRSWTGDDQDEDTDPEDIINAVKDWLDAEDDDAVTGLTGAESDYYQGLNPPYDCADGPFNHIHELMQVKGVTPALLKNRVIDPEMETDPGSVFTVHGLDPDPGQNRRFRYPGRINVNTAGIEVLSALLPEEMDIMAQDLLDFRVEKSEDQTVFINDLSPGWITRVISLPTEARKRLDRVVTYRSHVFKVRSRGVRNGVFVTLQAVLERERHAVTGKWTCSVIHLDRL